MAAGSQFNDAGNLTVSAGTLTTNASDVMSVGGALTVDGTLNLNNAISPSSVTIGSGGTLNANAAVSTSSLTLTGGGTQTGSGNVTVTGSLAWSSTGSTMSGSGVTIIASTATGTITGNVDLIRDLDIGGQVTVGQLNGGNSTIQMGSASVPGFVKVLTDGTLTLIGAVSGFGGDGILVAGGGFPVADPGTVENAGTIIQEQANSTSTIAVALTNDSGGVINAESGTLDLTGGGSSAGTMQAESGATLQFGGGTFTLAAGSQFNDAGNLTVSAGTLTTNASDVMSVGGALTVDGTLNLNNAISPSSVTIGSGGTLNANAAVSTSSLTLTGGGTQTGSGNVTVTGSLAWSSTGSTMSGSGVTIIASTATGTITGNVDLIRDLDIGGQVTVGQLNGGNSTIQMGSASVPGFVKVLTDGTLTLIGAVSGFGGDGILVAGGGFPVADPGTVENAGTIIQEQANSTSTIAVALTNDSGGVINAESGTLDLTGGLTNNGELELSGGTIDVSTAVTGSGTVLFSGAGSLGLAQPTGFNELISGFATTDTLDLGGLSSASGHAFTTSTNPSGANTTLTVTD